MYPTLNCNASRSPCEGDIQRVMTETGMQYHAARNHLIGRKIMLEKLEAERNRRYWTTIQVDTTS